MVAPCAGAFRDDMMMERVAMVLKTQAAVGHRRGGAVGVATVLATRRERQLVTDGDAPED
jgi:hypothetical protein